MKYDFNETVDRTGTASIKLEAGEKVNPYLPKEHIPLWVADMDFACAPEILRAMHERLDRRILGYTNLSGDCEASACRWMERRFGWKPTPEQIRDVRANSKSDKDAARRLNISVKTVARHKEKLGSSLFSQ